MLILCASGISFILSFYTDGFSIPLRYFLYQDTRLARFLRVKILLKTGSDCKRLVVLLISQKDYVPVIDNNYIAVLESELTG